MAVFSVKMNEDTIAMGNQILEKLGGTKGDAMAQVFRIAQDSFSEHGMETQYREHLAAVNTSLENIRATTLSIIRSAGEEALRKTDDLRMQLDAKDRVMSVLQQRIDALGSDLAKANEDVQRMTDALNAAQQEVDNVLSASAQQEDRHKAAIHDLQARIKEQADLIELQRSTISKLEGK